MPEIDKTATCLTLRRADPADADAVRDVTLAAYAKWVPIVGQKPVPMLADYGHAVVAHRIDVLEAEGRVVGLIELVAEADCLLIENVAVLPEHAGNGLGRLLMAHAEAVAREMGLGRLRLYTNRLMAANAAFYRRLGYAVDNEEPKPDGRVVLNMSKRL